MLASAWLLLWFAIFFVCIASFMRFWEEPHLAQRYGSAYLDYRGTFRVDSENLSLDAGECWLAVR